jgi:phosphorylase/glycogen(starch) synthase
MFIQHPNYLFEISWEVCNKVNGIHGKLSENAQHLQKLSTKDFFMIGPDVWRDKHNTEFTEDRELYRTWHEQAERDGLYFRIGRWNIPGNPMVLLVDYTSLFSQKDDIFKEFWETYKLDSISGQWDYIEPAIFGYAAGKIIEHFYQYNVMPNEHVLAQFHDWLTGSGVLYLKNKTPQIATVFTTHRTVIGQAVEAHNFPLNQDISQYNVDQLANNFLVRAKHSLEKLAAANTDVFTASSESISEQCRVFFGKIVDKITDNVAAYENAQTIALEKAIARSDSYTHIPLPFDYGVDERFKKMKPEWKKMLIRPHIPTKLIKLHELSMNLWWCWDCEAGNLFESINPDLFNRLERNPIALLKTMSSPEIEKLQNDTEFLKKLDRVYERFKAYMDAKTEQTPKVAYFSMEFGLHESVKIYSGGLGILAGDYLKEASDCNYNMIGVGLLYRYGYFKQQISIGGEQIAHSVAQRFSDLPLKPVRDENGRWIQTSISLPGRLLHAKIWRLDVGRVPLFLLDTDIENNTDQDRAITYNLYGGDWENRLKQEILLGVGGIRAIKKMRIKPDLYHCNEGHAAFISLERLRQMIEDENKSFVHAKELVRASTLFTTHTPVPAGHDAFSEDLMRTYISHYPKRLGISWEALMGLGRWNENDTHEKFSMSVLAANLSQEMNGVSRLHGRVTREMFDSLYAAYYPEELHIGYVTNGVHYKTWTHEDWQKLHVKYFGEKFEHDLSNPEHWKGIKNATDKEIWDIRTKLRTKLINFSKIKLEEDMTLREESPTTIEKALKGFDYNKLTIGFARRFATYKRAQLLFTNLPRLQEIVNHPSRPVQFVFAGKAHPADKAGQDLIKLILDVARRPEFVGKIFFLENYDIEIAKCLVQGVDIWMNTPTRPLEASGTSGEKAIMNGVLNLSVLDGWWAEGYKKGAGWALKEEQTYENDAFQNALDAETIYNLIENEITNAFYDIDKKTKISKRWIELIRNNFTEISWNFTMKRQLDDYIKQYYTPQFERSAILLEHNGRKAHELAQWKVKVAQAWNNLEVLNLDYHNSTQKPLQMGDTFEAKLVIDVKELSPEDIGVEMIYGQKVNDSVDKLLGVYEMKLEQSEGSIATFKLSFLATVSGVYDFAFRIFPTHPLLPHRQDFSLVKWA